MEDHRQWGVSTGLSAWYVIVKEFMIYFLNINNLIEYRAHYVSMATPQSVWEFPGFGLIGHKVTRMIFAEEVTVIVPIKGCKN